MVPDTAQSTSSPLAPRTPAHKRSRLDSLLHLASATATPDNSLPRRRKEVTRRTDQVGRAAKVCHVSTHICAFTLYLYISYLHIKHIKYIQDVQKMGEQELSTYQSGFTQSHANLGSTLTLEPSPGKYYLI